jgi:diguanylate cyclase (GGDEF)-like protein
MPKLIPALQPTEPDSATLERLARIERVALAAVVFLVAANIAGWLMFAASMHLPFNLQLMKGESAFAALFCALSMLFSMRQSSARFHGFSVLLASGAALLSIAAVCEYVFHVSFGIDVPAGAGHGLAALFAARMSFQTASGFAFLAVILLMQVRPQSAVAAADVLVFFLVLLVLVLVSGHLLAISHTFGPNSTVETSGWSMIALLLLTCVVFLRKAENGVYSILLGRGIGSNIARGLSPVLLVLPYLRESMRAHFVDFSHMPPHYTTAILASLAVMLSFALLLFLAWRINRMELEIHDLSLRDALTDLYNLRGFRLLAEQALRMARRSSLSFSVLFIDLDNLKRTNDTLGHQAGSDFLIETAKILKSSFRETDVAARIGGDEFAVAGQFSQAGISLAAQRIQECVARRNTECSGGPPLSLSIGYVTAESVQAETLSELLAKADYEMYEEKRRKKLAIS